jgi:hypothetical protein
MEGWQEIYFEVYKSQSRLEAKATETAALMLGADNTF